MEFGGQGPDVVALFRDDHNLQGNPLEAAPQQIRPLQPIML